MHTNSILIVGAGPTGMTAAIELKRAGFDVRIIDKSDHPALYSQALVVQARTLEQLQRYGIAAKAVTAGRKLKNATVWSEGKNIFSLAFDRIPSRYPFLLFLPQRGNRSHPERVHGIPRSENRAQNGTDLVHTTEWRRFRGAPSSRWRNGGDQRGLDHRLRWSAQLCTRAGGDPIRGWRRQPLILPGRLRGRRTRCARRRATWSIGTRETLCSWVDCPIKSPG